MCLEFKSMSLLLYFISAKKFNYKLQLIITSRINNKYLSISLFYLNHLKQARIDNLLGSYKENKKIALLLSFIYFYLLQLN